MHNLDVNFLKDRQELEPLVTDKAAGSGGGAGSQSNLPMIVGALIMLLLPALTFGYSAQLTSSNEKLQQEIDQTESQINQKKAQNKAIEQKRTQLANTRNENLALVSVFTQIKPWSALMQDISERIPNGVQITSIQQQENSNNTPGAIALEIQGTADNQGAVNDFLLTLQQSKFLAANRTRIDGSRIVSNPIQIQTTNEEINLQELGIELPDVVSYTITTELNDTPASELLDELSLKGAVGLVRRIKILQERGLIETK